MKYSVLLVTFMLSFVPRSYGDTLDILKQIPVQFKEIAVLAGGCFWGMEDIIRKIPGVVDTEVGYSGGRTDNPIYSQVSSGDTGHAEAVKIEFDKRTLSYDTLLDYFFRMHNPTTLNQQGNDRGTQYRSAIFFMDEVQHKTALEAIKKVEKSKSWDAKVVTEVTAFNKFTKAESYHQDYLVKNPGGYTCHWLRK